jgi:hypothetical protein
LAEVQPCRRLRREGAAEEIRQGGHHGPSIGAAGDGVGGFVDGGEEEAGGGLRIDGSEGLRLLPGADDGRDAHDGVVGQGLGEAVKSMKAAACRSTRPGQSTGPSSSVGKG